VACDGSCVNCCAEPPVGDGVRRAAPAGAFPPAAGARASSRAPSDCIDWLSFAQDAARWPCVGTRSRGIALFPRAFAVTFRGLAVEAWAFADADDEVVTDAGFTARDPEGCVDAGFAARDPDGRVGVCEEDVAAAGFGARGGGGPMGPPAADEPGSLATPFTAASLSATPAGIVWFRETPGVTEPEPATPTRIVVAPSLNAAAAISGAMERNASSWEVVMLNSTLLRTIDTASCEGFGMSERNFAAISSALSLAFARDAGVAVQPVHKQWHLQTLHSHAFITACVSGRLGSRLGTHTGQLEQF
jgi:hypothetical protein